MSKLDETLSFNISKKKFEEIVAGNSNHYFRFKSAWDSILGNGKDKNYTKIRFRNKDKVLHGKILRVDVVSNTLEGRFKTPRDCFDIHFEIVDNFSQQPYEFLKIGDITIETYNDDNYLITSPKGIITLGKDRLREYIIKGFSDNLKDLLKIKE